MLTKSPRYYWDGEAVRTPQQTLGERHEGASGYRDDHPNRYGYSTRSLNPSGANLRNYWLLGQPSLRLRGDLTEEQRAYVFERLAAHARRGLP